MTRFVRILRALVLCLAAQSCAEGSALEDGTDPTSAGGSAGAGGAAGVGASSTGGNPPVTHGGAPALAGAPGVGGTGSGGLGSDTGGKGGSDGPGAGGTGGDGGAPTSSFDGGTVDDGGGAGCAACPPSKQITISGNDATGVKGAHTGFPVLVRIASDPELQGLDARDFRFTSDAAGLGDLPFERETYDSVTGELIAWVQVDLTGLDQIFYLVYGEGNLTDYSSPAVVWTRFRHVWHQESTSSVDRAGSSNLSPVDAVSTVSAVIGDGTDFDGSDDYQTFTGTYSGSDALTISAWLRRDAIGSRMEALSLGPGATWADNDSLIFRVNGSDVASAGWKNNTVSGASTLAAVGTWYHVVWTFSGGAGTSSVYVNGVEDGTGVHVAPNSTGTTGVIGARHDALSGDFDGIIDEVRWSNDVRSADWILTEYNNQRIGSTFLTIE